MSKFQINRSSDSQYRFILIADNGRTILIGEPYTTIKSCIRGIISVKANSQLDSQYECFISQDEQHYFIIKAKNGETIGTSETYTTKEDRDNGILCVKKNAPVAPIVRI